MPTAEAAPGIEVDLRFNPASIKPLVALMMDELARAGAAADKVVVLWQLAPCGRRSQIATMGGRPSADVLRLGVYREYEPAAKPAHTRKLTRQRLFTDPARASSPAGGYYFCGVDEPAAGGAVRAPSATRGPHCPFQLSSPLSPVR